MTVIHDYELHVCMFKTCICCDKLLLIVQIQWKNLTLKCTAFNLDQRVLKTEEEQWNAVFTERITAEKVM